MRPTRRCSETVWTFSWAPTILGLTPRQKFFKMARNDVVMTVVVSYYRINHPIIIKRFSITFISWRFESKKIYKILGIARPTKQTWKACAETHLVCNWVYPPQRCRVRLNKLTLVVEMIKLRIIFLQKVGIVLLIHFCQIYTTKKIWNKSLR